MAAARPTIVTRTGALPELIEHERSGLVVTPDEPHEMAAGLKIKPENFDDFRRCFCKYAYEHLEPDQLVPELKLDAEAELRQVTADLVSDLQRLGPFGHGNRRPVFCSRGLEIAAPPRRVGKTGNHLQLFLRQGRTSMKAIASL